jgi:short-subunit dehydrogenase
MDPLANRKVILTGASSGIGEQMAYLLAQRHCQLRLVARNEAKLEKVCSAIRERYGTPCDFFVCDLANSADVDQLIRVCPETDILINNAGFSHYGFFDKTPYDRTERLIDTNVTALCRLCYHYLQGMQRHRFGRILNVASTAALTPVPYMAVYGAAKAFVVHFSRSLALEVDSKNLSVSCLLPGPTATDFWKVSGADAKVAGKTKHFASPQEVARFGIQLMEAGQPYGIFGWDNRLKAFLKRLLPDSWVAAFMRKHMTHASLFREADGFPKE